MAKYLTIQNNVNTSIVSGDLLGQIGFASSVDSDGGDAIKITAAISAEAEGTFNASANPAALVFSTGPDMTATGQLKITNGGHFVPLYNAQKDLGDSSSYFRTLYVSGIDFNGLGTQTLPFNDFNVAANTDTVTVTDGNTVTFTGQDSVTVSRNGQTIIISGSGGGGGGGTPAGSDTEVQFNDGGAFGADANFTYDKTNTKLSVIGPYSTGFLATGVTEDAEENLIQFKSTNDAGSQGYLFRYTRDGKLYLGQNGSYDIRTYLGGTNSNQNELRISRDGLSSYIGLNPFGRYINIDGGGGEYLQFDSTTSLYNDTSHTFGMRNGSNPYGLRIYASGNTTNYARLSIQANTSDYNYEISPQVNNGVAGSVVVTNDTSSQEILVVRGATSQSANLTEWQNSSSVVQAYIDETGGFSGTCITFGDGTTQCTAGGGGMTSWTIADGSGNTEAVGDADTLYISGAGSVVTDYNTTTNVMTISGAGGGGGTPGGSDTHVQFNDGGSTFGGNAGFTYDKTAQKMYSRSYYTNITDSGNITTSVTLDLDESNFHQVTLSGNPITIAVSNGDVGQRFIIRLKQDNTGSRTVNWFSTISWPGGGPPTLSAATGVADLLGFVVTAANEYDGFLMVSGIY